MSILFFCYESTKSELSGLSIGQAFSSIVKVALWEEMYFGPCNPHIIWEYFTPVLLDPRVIEIFRKKEDETKIFISSILREITTAN